MLEFYDAQCISVWKKQIFFMRPILVLQVLERIYLSVEGVAGRLLY